MLESAATKRETSETQISCSLTVHGTGIQRISTGLAFLDHMLHAFTKTSRIDLSLTASGDLIVDDHHTVEDVALVLGETVRKCVGDGMGIERHGHSYVAMDEALARTVIDVSGRPSAVITLNLKREMVGGIAAENFEHFFQSFANKFGCALHIDVLRGNNDHHKIEAAFKSFGRALRMALTVSEYADIPSTKGSLL